MAKTDSRKSPEEWIARMLQGNVAGMNQLETHATSLSFSIFRKKHLIGLVGSWDFLLAGGKQTS